jgi:TIR domain
MIDFFVSYTSADARWAEWIAYVLEEERYSVILQAWDFRPGSNFILEMQDAAKKAARTIMVLSPDYMKSQFGSPEWAAAFASDPQSLKRKLVPVVVRPCEPDGLLGQIVHITLVGLGKNEARQQLIAGVRNERAKPTSPPVFPGEVHGSDKPFPGRGDDASQTAVETYIPKVKRAATDVDKRRFLKAAFSTIRDYFEGALPQLARQTTGMEFDFQSVTALEFTSEIFVAGKSAATCRIWQGGDMLSRDGIAYAEGRHHSSASLNESLHVSERNGDLALAPMMEGFGYSANKPTFDTKNMTPSQAAEYLWRRFISPLER